MFDSLTQALVNFVSSVVNMLPNSPFLFLQEVQAPATVIMGYVNWFIDFRKIIEITILWQGGILGWYTYRSIFKWAKMAG